jgi:hypothetical protein
MISLLLYIGDLMKFNLFICILFFSSFSYSSYQYETVLDELDDAWSFVFLSEDKILYTEMPGALKVGILRMINLL